MRRSFSQDLILRSRTEQPLSLEEMRQRLPAIFAPKAHSSRSERYVYVSTADVVEVLGENGFHPFEARVTRSREFHKQPYAKHMIRFRSQAIVPYAKDNRIGDVSFEVILKNSHDGSGAYDFLAGLFRLVCLNGMVVGAGDVASVHVRHSGNRQKILDSVVEGAHAVLATAPIALEAPKLWSTIELTRDEQHVFADAARIVRFGDKEGKVNSPITAEQLLAPKRPADEGNDLWKTFNRVQEHAVRGGDSSYRNGRRATSREVKAIDGDVKLNRALWQLADEMAKLKLGAR